MTGQPDTPDETPEPEPLTLTMRMGRLVVQPAGFIVGEFTNDEITLNLGWCRAAGIGVRCISDPEVDRKRDGIVLHRPAEPQR